MRETLGEQRFARVRTSAGAEGWMTARYLSGQPAAKDRLSQMESDLDAARTQIKSFQDELKSAKQQIDATRPTFGLSPENTRLKRELAAKEEAMATDEKRYKGRRAKTGTLDRGGGERE